MSELRPSGNSTAFSLELVGVRVLVLTTACEQIEAELQFARDVLVAMPHTRELVAHIDRAMKLAREALTATTVVARPKDQ